MTRAHKCVDETDVTNITVKERGRRVNFENPKRARFRKVQVDQCLITEGERADWIISAIGVASIIIELKGCDVEHACAQLFTTLKHDLSQEWLEKTKVLLIICARYPQYDTRIARYMESAKKLGCRLKIYTNERSVTVEELLNG